MWGSSLTQQHQQKQYKVNKGQENRLTVLCSLITEKKIVDVTAEGRSMEDLLVKLFPKVLEPVFTD